MSVLTESDLNFMSLLTICSTISVDSSALKPPCFSRVSMMASLDSPAAFCDVVNRAIAFVCSE